LQTRGSGEDLRGFSDGRRIKPERTYRINAHQRQSTQRTRLITLSDLTRNSRLSIQRNDRDLTLGRSLLQDEVRAYIRSLSDGREGFGNVVGCVECVVGGEREGEDVVC
jgi:hypothetical protein